MIEELRIRDLGVIADATLTLGPGFTAITGETGAGKTMVVTALGLLMGERADASAVRGGAQQARVNGVIRTDSHGVAEIVADLGGDVDDGDLVLGRAVSAEGRSRATVGGAPAPVNALGRLAERLFAVHGQSEQLRLRSTAAQRHTLDRFGGDTLSGALRAYLDAHRARIECEERLRELQDTREARTAEASRLREMIEHVRAVDPQAGEEAELAARIEVLGNIEALRAATGGALAALSQESGDPHQRDAIGLIDGALRELERVTEIDARLRSITSTVREVSFQVSDAARELAAYVSDLDEDAPGELARANERLATLAALFRVAGVNSRDVLAAEADASLRLAELENDDDQIVELSERSHRLSIEERDLASQLTRLREGAAKTLSLEVSAELKHLALPDAEFVVQVSANDRLTEHGADDIKFLLSPHPGAEARPLAKSASGGELSRVMLALEVVVAGVDPVPTFVFDEVDAGIGGAAAIEVGRRLARLAKNSQVIVVTHLAQVAAFANNHLRVRKDSAGGYTESSCAALTGEDRLGEIARLLSGLSDSESALQHAQELLQLGKNL